MTDDVTEIMKELTMKDLGIEEGGERALSSSLTPLKELPPVLFKSREAFGFLRRKEEIKPLTLQQRALAQLSVKLYDELLRQIREGAAKSQHPSVRQHYGEKGKVTKIVGDVAVLPVGPPSRFLVNFTTTNMRGESDWEALVSSFMFDITPAELNKTYPARERSWIVGKRQQNYQIVGNYKQLYSESQGKVKEFLKAQGHEEIAEIWPVDINRHAGFIRQPSSSNQ